jgi:serine/threonine protein kinase
LWSSFEAQLFGIAKGIEYLHSVGVIHGDISNVPTSSVCAPSQSSHAHAQMNILLADAGHPVLADFGLVLLAECTIGGFSVTTNGFNPRWTSPQRLNDTVRAKSDEVYSFGCVCYYVSFPSTSQCR